LGRNWAGGQHQGRHDTLRGRVVRCVFTSIVVTAILPAGWAASVRQFGAKGDGRTDDTSALEKAIAKTRSGTLLFPGGTYRISRTLQLVSNVTYQGEGSAVLTGTNGGSILALPYTQPVNIKIVGLTFDGGGLTAQGDPGVYIRITGNTFRNLIVRSQNWTLRNAIFAAGGFRQSSIDHNVFQNILPNGSTRPDGSGNSIDDTNTGIMVYVLDATRIENNTFDHVGQGLKVCFAQKYRSRNVYVGYNVMRYIHRMGMEFQGATGCGGLKRLLEGPNTEHILIEYNKITDWIDPYWNSFGISFADPAPEGANGVIIRNNVVICGPASYWKTENSKGHYGYGLETSGAGLEIYGNIVAGYFEQAITVWAGSTNAQIHDNYACAREHEARMEIGEEAGPSAGARYYNNTVLRSCPTQLPAPTSQPSASAFSLQP